jgi:hypothetical protein
VKNGLTHWTTFLPVLLLILVLLSLISVVPSQSEDLDPNCGAIRDYWEQSMNRLKDKVQEISSVQQASAARLADKPSVESNLSKTIAKQIGDALQVKENILSHKRNECKELMNAEGQLFDRLQECLKSGRTTKDKDVKNLAKRRQALIDKAVVAAAEVREVEGRETVLPYSEAARDDYSRSVNNYWQGYQQMYRRWGGY